VDIGGKNYDTSLEGIKKRVPIKEPETIKEPVLRQYTDKQLLITHNYCIVFRLFHIVVLLDFIKKTCTHNGI
jgi:hypothetical protein